jgi:hypothetical protein
MKLLALLGLNEPLIFSKFKLKTKCTCIVFYIFFNLNRFLGLAGAILSACLIFKSKLVFLGAQIQPILIISYPYAVGDNWYKN